MAGHSKWSNIKHRKGRQDAKKGKMFTSISKEIFAAVRSGGDDPASNTKLRLAMNKAKAANMPNDNVERTIKKATGNLDGVTYENITYEGYGPNGVAIFVEALTDNKNRTAAEMRLAFNKNGGNLGETGCVAFMFQRSGYLVVEFEANETDEESLMLAAIESGADDVMSEDEGLEIITEAETFESVRDSLEKEGVTFTEAEVTMLPNVKTKLPVNESEEILRLIDVLEDNDDVQEVYHNLEIIDE
ncbi:YebC/PmpR family DNA-binding transcriptional regulator [Alteribacter populi]|uniref:YebC/PmpR family DNA-binding transcriptional regulator n=1 Tax=Alteribacter populi TaxID=2011011 RepID=UPI000BBAEA14|nr:YebC/PmpR family DNA-binding transcriptional regulator [Alteribacter populi]